MFNKLFCKNCHEDQCWCGKYFNRPDCGLLLIRIGLAVVFIIHGWLKLQNIDQTAEFFATLGLGIFWVYVVGLVEFFGGILLLLGVWAREAGLLLAINMLFAIILVKFEKGFVNGYEYDLVLFLSVMAIVFTGSGQRSIRCCKK
jgi:putative oxidoreductase